MAFASTAHATAARNKSFGKSVAQFFDALGQGLAAYMERHARMAEITRLNEMTDAQLAELGVKRDRIAHYVFRDRFYI
jgi:uncharacterized protein YjiS (DUF1127 family)